MKSPDIIGSGLDSFFSPFSFRLQLPSLWAVMAHKSLAMIRSLVACGMSHSYLGAMLSILKQISWITFGLAPLFSFKLPTWRLSSTYITILWRSAASLKWPRWSLMLISFLRLLTRFMYGPSGSGSGSTAGSFAPASSSESICSAFSSVSWPTPTPWLCCRTVFSGVVTSGSKLSQQNTGTYVCRWQSWIPTLVTSGQKRVSCKLQQRNFEMMLQVLKQAKECYQTWWIQFTFVWWKWAAMQGCPNCLLSRGDTCTLRREATSQPRGQWDNRNSFKLTKPESPKWKFQSMSKLCQRKMFHPWTHWAAQACIGLHRLHHRAAPFQTETFPWVKSAST